MTVLSYRDRSYVRIISTRTGETLFEIRMLGGAVIIWGAHYRPSDFDARLGDDGCTITLHGELCDRLGAVVTFGEQLDVATGYSVEIGALPEGYDGSWTRDRT